MSIEDKINKYLNEAEFKPLKQASPTEILLYGDVMKYTKGEEDVAIEVPFKPNVLLFRDGQFNNPRYAPVYMVYREDNKFILERDDDMKKEKKEYKNIKELITSMNKMWAFDFVGYNRV